MLLKIHPYTSHHTECRTRDGSLSVGAKCWTAELLDCHSLCFLETKADPEAPLPVMGGEAAGFVCRHELGREDCPPRIADHTVAEIESEYETSRGVVFNDAAKIEIRFRSGGPFVREDAAAWFLNAEWITSKMNEAWSSL